MDMNREQLLKEVMAAGFTAYDLHLYLNTHPYDQRALMLFNQATQRARLVTDQFERMYGPLTASSSTGFPWQWIQNPWPWEG